MENKKRGKKYLKMIYKKKKKKKKKKLLKTIKIN